MSDAIWQLLYPKFGSEYGVLDLSDMLMVEQGRGIPPLHYNVQRGTYQHGETPINMRLDPRVIQVAITDQARSRPELYETMALLLKRVSPGRNWLAKDDSVRRCIYRKIMPGGRRQWRSDLTTTAGSKTVISPTGRFAEWGLGPGDAFVILTGADAGDYVVSSVINENMLELTAALTSTAASVHYRLVNGHVTRDLYVLLEAGPTLEDDRREDSYSADDALRLIAHDPIWRNPLRQSITWTVTDLSNLIFYESPNYLDRAVFPIWFGMDSILASTSLVYLGTWMSRPMIIANGPFTSLTLENLSTGDKLILAHQAVSGEQVTVNLESLTVTNNFGQNLMRYMSTPYASADSDLITFGLYPEPHVQGGINAINLTISGAVLGSTSAQMYWYSRYIGV